MAAAAATAGGAISPATPAYRKCPAPPRPGAWSPDPSGCHSPGLCLASQAMILWEDPLQSPCQSVLRPRWVVQVSGSDTDGASDQHRSRQNVVSRVVRASRVTSQGLQVEPLITKQTEYTHYARIR